MLAQKLMGAKGASETVSGFISVTSGNSISNGTAAEGYLSLSTPDGASSGDLLLVVGIMSRAPSSFPAGWTVALNSSSRFVAYGIHDGIADSYTFSSAASTRIAAALLCFRGCAYGVTGVLSGAAQNPSAPSITTSEALSDLVAFASADPASNTYAPPSGWGAIANIATGCSLCVALKDTSVGAGATGSVSFTRTSGTSTTGRAHQLSVHPN